MRKKVRLVMVIAGFIVFVLFVLTLKGQTPQEPTRDEKISLRAQEIELEKKLKEVKDKEKKLRSPAEKKAEKEISAEEKKEAKNRKLEDQVSINAHLTGCPAHTVWVDARVEHPSSMNVMVSVTITNTSRLTIDEIVSPRYGPIVRNLCSRGSITVYFVMDVWKDSMTVQVPLKAIARPPDGGIATEDFGQVNLNVNNIQNMRVTNLTWQVGLNRIQQTR